MRTTRRINGQAHKSYLLDVPGVPDNSSLVQVTLERGADLQLATDR